MTVFQAIILGAVQGVSEFLPISSDGHLSLVQQYFGLSGDLLAFDVFLHFFTFLAVVTFFFRDILQLRIKDYLVLAVGTIPAVIIGLLFESTVQDLLHSSVFVGMALIVTGLLNFASHSRFKKKSATEVDAKKLMPQDVKYGDAVRIGILQAIAILPGISRSGSTIFGASMIGMSRISAFRFSFLLGLPAIFGATLLQGLRAFQTGFGNIPSSALIAGGFTAGVVGFASLSLFALLMRKGNLNWFGWYCVVLGAGVLLFTQM